MARPVGSAGRAIFFTGTRYLEFAMSIGKRKNYSQVAFDGLDPSIRPKSAEQAIGEIKQLMLKFFGERQQSHFSTAQFGKIVGLSDWMVRQYCNLGRICATKTHTACGRHFRWSISKIELDRFQKEGLLPIRKR